MIELLSYLLTRIKYLTYGLVYDFEPIHEVVQKDRRSALYLLKTGMFNGTNLDKPEWISSISKTVTPLQYALNTGNLDLAKALVDIGADHSEIWWPTRSKFKTEHDAHSAWSWLIDIDKSTYNKWLEENYAIWIALIDGDIETLGFFCKRGFDPLKPSELDKLYRYSSISMALMSSKKREAFELLLEQTLRIHNVKGTYLKLKRSEILSFVLGEIIARTHREIPHYSVDKLTNDIDYIFESNNNLIGHIETLPRINGDSYLINRINLDWNERDFERIVICLNTHLGARLWDCDLKELIDRLSNSRLKTISLYLDLSMYVQKSSSSDVKEPLWFSTISSWSGPEYVLETLEVLTEIGIDIRQTDSVGESIISRISFDEGWSTSDFTEKLNHKFRLSIE